MAKALMKMNDKNLKDINDHCSGNLELQTLVMATIDEYKGGPSCGRRSAAELNRSPSLAV